MINIFNPNCDYKKEGKSRAKKILDVLQFSILVLFSQLSTKLRFNAEKYKNKKNNLNKKMIIYA